MATIEITESNLQEEVAKGGLLLLDFWADWCGPCKAFGPVYEALSEQHLDITFGKVDTEASPGLAAAAGISAIPTLVAFKNGTLVFSQAGALPRPALADVIQQLRTLDTDQVRVNAQAHPGHAPHVSEG
ncbi:thioredoxin family protein [Cellulosimicrobium cellulans]|uniref:thioredoxin family protein n=1 Tax=Cellulosimicrobium cellulans TaxID=1710 RepID=UPI003809F1EE